MAHAFLSDPSCSSSALRSLAKQPAALGTAPPTPSSAAHAICTVRWTRATGGFETRYCLQLDNGQTRDYYCLPFFLAAVLVQTQNRPCWRHVRRSNRIWSSICFLLSKQDARRSPVPSVGQNRENQGPSRPKIYSASHQNLLAHADLFGDWLCFSYQALRQDTSAILKRSPHFSGPCGLPTFSALIPP